MAWYWDGCVRALSAYILWGFPDGVKGIGAGSMARVRARHFTSGIQGTREGESDVDVGERGCILSENDTFGCGKKGN